LAEPGVLLLTRDLFFRAKLEAVVRAAGLEPVRGEPARLAVVELNGPDALTRVAGLVSGGTPVIAFSSHVQADLLRGAREAGAEAVPNSKVEAALAARLRQETRPR
jgi:hypothetical protein